MFELRMHGLGGQGAVTLVTWFVQVGYKTGKHVQAFPFFGAERRGAPVKAYARIDDKPIDLRSQIYHPVLLVIMSPDLSGIALAEGIAPHGRVLLNSGEELAVRLAARFERDMDYLDATGIAIDEGLEVEGMPMVNIPLLGAMVAEWGGADMDMVMEVLDRVAKRGNYAAYESAARHGFEGVRTIKAGAAVGEAAAADHLRR